jgi:hypothetical protein
MSGKLTRKLADLTRKAAKRRRVRPDRGGDERDPRLAQLRCESDQLLYLVLANTDYLPMRYRE